MLVHRAAMAANLGLCSVPTAFEHGGICYENIYRNDNKETTNYSTKPMDSLQERSKDAFDVDSQVKQRICRFGAVNWVE